MAFTNLFIDTFTRTNGAVANGWTDPTSSYNIVSNTLQIASTAVTDFGTKYLYRATDGATRSLMVFQATNALGLTNAKVAAALRVGSGGNYYMVDTTGSGTITIVPVIGGTLLAGAASIGGSPTFTCVVGNYYSIELISVGSNPTILKSVMTNLGTAATPANTVIATAIGVDPGSTGATAVLQDITRGSGLIGWARTSTGTATFSPDVTGNVPSGAGFISFSGTSTAAVGALMTIAAPAGAVSSPVTLTFTLDAPAGASTVITPTQTGGTGTFSPTTVTIASGASSGTCTWTPSATGTSTFAMTSAPALTYMYYGSTPGLTTNPVVYAAGSTSISLSPTTVPANTVTVVAVTGSGTSFSGSGVAVPSGTLTGAQWSSATVDTTHANLTIDPGITVGTTLTITAGGATAPLVVGPPALGSLNVISVGDSITASDTGGGGMSPSTFGLYLFDGMQAQIRKLGYLTPRATALGVTNGHNWMNNAYDGCDSNYWAQLVANSSYPLSGNVPDGTPWGTFTMLTMLQRNIGLASFPSDGSGIISIMIGTNDGRNRTAPYGPGGAGRPANTAAIYLANMKVCINFITTTLNCKAIFHKMPYTIPYSGNSGQIFGQNVNDLYQTYWAAAMTLVDNVKVFIGDTTAYQQSQAAPASFLYSDGIHPGSTANSTLIGQLHALAIVNKFGVPQTGGGGGTGNKWTHG